MKLSIISLFGLSTALPVIPTKATSDALESRLVTKAPVNTIPSTPIAVARPARAASLRAAVHSGDGRISKKPEKEPPAVAIAYHNGNDGGMIKTNKDDNLSREQKEISLSYHPDRRVVIGPNSAYAESNNFGGGGGASIQASNMVKAELQNGLQVNGCIECHLPDQNPIIVRAKSGAIVDVETFNKHPEKGQAKITVSQDGRGIAKVKGTNLVW